MIDRLKKKSITAHFKEVFTIFLFLENRKKLKKITQNYNVLIKELERLFVKNPVDLPTARLKEEDYYSLIRVALIITSHIECQIIKDSYEWSYFSSKWNSLHNYRAVEQLNSFNTYHDIFKEILKNWDKLKHSPYTYRCIASLIRMLGDK